MNYRLFTPGPAEINLDIFKIIKRGIPYHREESFSALFSRIETKLKNMLYLEDGRVYILTCSGTGAMEAAVLNIFDEKDRVLVVSTGKFGDRWMDICNIWSIPTELIRFDNGKSIDVDMVMKKIKKGNYTGILTTLTETSTGALNDIESMGKELNKKAIFVVDAIAGFGVDQLKASEWGVDVVVGGSQKTLTSPPGIAFLGISKRVVEKIKKRKKPKSYYFDLFTYESFLKRGETPYTPAILTLLYMDKILSIIERKGYENFIKIHERWAGFVRKNAKNLGFRIFPENPSNALVVISTKKKSSLYIKQILKKFKILFANGQKELKNKIIRIGMMGHANKKDAELIREALKYAKRRVE